jgi:hypothetical protein
MTGLLLLAACIGCSSGHVVKYKLGRADTWGGPPVSGVLRVMPLVDQTTPVTVKAVKEGEYTYRPNTREFYRQQEIANNVTEMLIKHLKASGLFKDVVNHNSTATATLELTGTIADYSSRGRVNKGAETTQLTCLCIGIPFVPIGPLIGNLIGAGITAGAKTDVEASVSLKDMTLRPVGGTQVLWQDTINVRTNFTAHWSHAYPLNVMKHADNCLQPAVNEMIQQVGKTLSAQPAK